VLEKKKERVHLSFDAIFRKKRGPREKRSTKSLRDQEGACFFAHAAKGKAFDRHLRALSKKNLGKRHGYVAVAGKRKGKGNASRPNWRTMLFCRTNNGRERGGEVLPDVVLRGREGQSFCCLDFAEGMAVEMSNVKEALASEVKRKGSAKECLFCWQKAKGEKGRGRVIPAIGGGRKNCVLTRAYGLPIPTAERKKPKEKERSLMRI